MVIDMKPFPDKRTIKITNIEEIKDYYRNSLVGLRVYDGDIFYTADECYGRFLSPGQEIVVSTYESKDYKRIDKIHRFLSIP